MDPRVETLFVDGEPDWRLVRFQGDEENLFRGHFLSGKLEGNEESEGEGRCP
jgi:hypothetical protein